MAKSTAKDNENIFLKRRKELGLTREKASELLGCIPPEAIEKIENDRRQPYPDEVVMFAEKYNSPEFCNYYCRNKCSIGKKLDIPEIKVQHLSQIIVKMLNSLNIVQDKQKKLLEIAEDEVIEDKEIEDFINIQKDLEKISSAVESLKV